MKGTPLSPLMPAAPGGWRGPPVALIGAFPPPLGGQAIYNARLAQEVSARGIPVAEVNVGVAVPGSPPSLTRRSLVALLLREDFTLYHLTASDSRVIGLELIVAAASFARRTPFVATILAGRFPERTASYAPLHRLLLYLALSRAERIMVANERMASALRGGRLLARAPIEVVGCQLPLGEVPEEDPELAAFLKGGDPSIVAVGALRHVYGLDVLVRACTLLHDRGAHPRLLLIISGETEKAAEAALKAALAEARGAWPFLIRRDVPRARVLAAMQAAHVVARPTRADGDSVSIHEALSLGVPVVASDAAPRPPGVTMHRTDDPDSLANSLRVACTMPRRSLPDDTTVVDHVVACYRSIMERRRSD